MKYFIILTFIIISKFVFSADSTEYYLSHHEWVCININYSGNLFSADTLEFQEGSWTFNKYTLKFDKAEKSFSFYGIAQDSTGSVSGTDYKWTISKNESNLEKYILTIEDIETKTFHQYFIATLDRKKLILIQKK